MSDATNSTTQNCGNCKFVMLEPTDMRKAACRRFPPTFVAFASPAGVAQVTGYPTVNVSDRGCGEHKFKVSLVS